MSLTWVLYLTKKMILEENESHLSSIPHQNTDFGGKWVSLELYTSPNNWFWRKMSLTWGVLYLTKIMILEENESGTRWTTPWLIKTKYTTKNNATQDGNSDDFGIHKTYFAKTCYLYRSPPVLAFNTMEKIRNKKNTSSSGDRLAYTLYYILVPAFLYTHGSTAYIAETESLS